MPVGGSPMPSSQDPSRRTFLAQSAAVSLILAADLRVGAAPAKDNPMPPAELKSKLVQCLGGAWPEPCDLKPVLRETTQKDGYRIESVTYEVEPGDRVPALVLIPDGVTASHAAPALAVWHQHNGAYHIGKIEPAGLGGSPMHHT